MKGNTTACAVAVEQVPAWKVKDGRTWGAQASVSVQRAPIAVAVLRRHGLERGQYQEGHSILKLRRPKTATGADM